MTDPKPDALAVAASLAKLGWAVFPVGPDKRPLVPWGTAATTDLEQVATWWGLEHVGAAVGVHAGRSGLVLVDVDEKGGVSGSANLAAAGIVLPKTLNYSTPSGGRHHVYRASAGVDLTIAQGTPVPGVDIRAGVGFAIYYGRPLTAARAARIADAPEWSLVHRKVANTRQSLVGDLMTWRERMIPGQAAKPLRRALKAIGFDGVDHATMLEATSAAVRLARTEGDLAAIDGARERYTRDWPEHGRHWDNALEGSIREFGLPPVTLPLSKAERKAIRDRVRGTTSAKPHERDGSIYVDVAAVLDGDLSAPEPDAGGVRTGDGLRLLYRSAVNGIVGEPETGKGIVAVAMAADELRRGGSCAWIDADYNGAPAILSRLIAAQIDRATLTDRTRFRLSVPDGPEAIREVIDDALKWRPTLVAVDSIGELVPMFGGESNDADDYSRVHREVLRPLADAGAAVLVLDHVAKSSLGSGYASGTGAKKRAMDGAYYALERIETFAPGKGGAAALKILKDRHGGIRARTEGDLAAVFRLDSRHDVWDWDFHPGRSEADRASDDVRAVLALDPFPASRAELQAAIKAATGGKGWGNDRASVALAEAKRRRDSDSSATD